MWLLEIECFLLLNNPHDYLTLPTKSETSQHNIVITYSFHIIQCVYCVAH